MQKAKTWLLRIGIAFIVVVLVALAVFWKDIQEIRAIMAYAGTFEPDTINENFRTLYQKYPSKTMRRSGPVYDLSINPTDLPQTYRWEGQTKSIPEWIEWTGTTGLIVVKDGSIVFENYYRGNDKATRSIAMSVSKSLVSCLVGIAVAEGKIESIEDPVDKYAPLLKDSGYRGVSLKNVLQMSSGIRFVEDYGDLQSDIVRLVASFLTGSVNAFVATLSNERKPGTFNRYVSADTQVLSMVLEGATGKNLTDYGREKLWSRLGVEYDAEWLTDPNGMEMAFGGLNAALQDYARFGLLYLNQGRNYKGEQLVPADWVHASVTPDAPHLMPGRDNKASSFPMGYGFQWWIPEHSKGDYTAIGIYGQFIYVNPSHNVVIAKTSAYADYNNTGDEMEFESMEAFRAIAEGL